MLRVIVFRKPGNFDSDDVQFEIYNRLVGSGFIEKNSGHIGLIRCPECHRENYAPNVSSGICSSCGFDANQESIKIIEEETDEH